MDTQHSDYERHIVFRREFRMISEVANREEPHQGWIDHPSGAG